ncbi:hypothetical protein [Endomicrobium proavitum]|uniref:Lipoprotein n=1 Tax=Endomicrobium proavitum TaxID=1408281 RepID=A0A0G3WGS5_9BACT|nr:hypothetical protein [Endomicrobium proavitum]AKL97876.1 exported protein of unknown function [Endomicrobium proavitum]
MKKINTILILFAIMTLCSSQVLSARHNNNHRHRGNVKVGVYYDFGFRPYHGYWNYDPYYNYYKNYYYDTQYQKKKAIAALDEIKLLEQIKADSAAAEIELFKIRVVKTRFYKQYFTDRIPESTAEITVQNNSDKEIAKLFFHGKIVTHISGNVLIDDYFAYDLQEPLDQGETQTYNIPLNSFGGWAKVQAPDLAVFSVDVNGFMSTDAEVFAPAWTVEDQKKLDQLKSKYVK